MIDSKKWSISRASSVPTGQDYANNRKSFPYTIWETRRKTLQSYISITLGMGNMVQFAAAIAIYGAILWVPYLILAVTIGVPLITAEITLGHYVSGDIKSVWKMCPIGIGIFFNSLIVTMMNTVYSQVYLTYLLHFSIDADPSIFSGKQIAERKNAACNSSYTNQTVISYGHTCLSEWSRNSIFHEQDAIMDAYFIPKERRFFPIIYISILTFVTLVINCKGVRSIEKFTTFTVLIPYLCAVLFLIVILTLPKSIDHIKSCFDIAWHHIANFEVWMLSFKHVVFGFGIGNLNIPFVAVHSDFHDDIMVDVVFIFLTHLTGTMLYTFTLLGLMGTLTRNTKLLEVIEDEPPNDYLSVLLWIIQGLEYLPPPRGYWSFVFVTTVTVAEISVQNFMFAAVTDSFIALFPKLRSNIFYVVFGVATVFLSVSIALVCFKIMKFPSLGASFLSIGFLEGITIFWIYNYQMISDDFHFLMGYKPSLFLLSTWVICPLIFLVFLLLMILHQDIIDIMSKNVIIFAPVHFLIFCGCGALEASRLWKKKENYNVFKINKYWGPYDSLLRKSREIFKSRVITKEHIYRQKLYKKQLTKPFDITNQNIVQLL